MRQEAANKILNYFMKRRTAANVDRFPALGVEFDWAFSMLSLEGAGIPEHRRPSTQRNLIRLTMKEKTSHYPMASTVKQALQRLSPDHAIFCTEPEGTFERLLELSLRVSTESDVSTMSMSLDSGPTGGGSL